MRKFSFIFIVSIFFLFLFAQFSFAQQQTVSEYKLFEPIPGIPGGQNAPPVSLSQYLNAVYKIGIILAAVLAVLMITIGGIQYVLAGGSITSTETAKDTIWQAIYGLLLVLLSYLILYVINPDLTRMEITSLTSFDGTAGQTQMQGPQTMTNPTPTCVDCTASQTTIDNCNDALTGSSWDDCACKCSGGL